MPDGDYYTRATWRVGKKRRLLKRIKPWGGQTTAPAGFLEAGKRNAFKPGRPGYRVCSATKRDGTPCRRLAMKGCKGCESHGGILALARQGKFQPSGRTAAFNATRPKAVEGRTPPASFDLMRLPIYRRADQRTRMRLIRAWGTPAWFAILRQC